jgi:predicted DNA-binding protein (UPF0251 family)
MEGLSQEEAGQRMSISRGTVWRLVQSTRNKSAQALSERRLICIVTFTANKAALKTIMEQNSVIVSPTK